MENRICISIILSIIIYGASIKFNISSSRSLTLLCKLLDRFLIQHSPSCRNIDYSRVSISGLPQSRYRGHKSRVLKEAETELKLINGAGIIAPSPMSNNINPSDVPTTVLISGSRAFCLASLCRERYQWSRRVIRVSRTCYLG